MGLIAGFLTVFAYCGMSQSLIFTNVKTTPENAVQFFGPARTMSFTRSNLLTT